MRASPVLVCFSGSRSWGCCPGDSIREQAHPQTGGGQGPRDDLRDFVGLARRSQTKPRVVAHVLFQSPGGSAGSSQIRLQPEDRRRHERLDSNQVRRDHRNPATGGQGRPCCQEGRLLGPDRGGPARKATQCNELQQQLADGFGVKGLTGLTADQMAAYLASGEAKRAGWIEVSATPKNRGNPGVSAIEAANEKAREGDYVVGVITSAARNEAKPKEAGSFTHGHVVAVTPSGGDDWEKPPWWQAPTRERSRRPASSPPAKSRMPGNVPSTNSTPSHSNEATTSPSRPLRSEEESLAQSVQGLW